MASGSAVFPPRDEAIPWIPDHGKSEIPGGGRCVFRAQHPIVHEVPIRVGGIEIKGVNDRRSRAFSLVDENAFVSVGDHAPWTVLVAGTGSFTREVIRLAQLGAQVTIYPLLGLLLLAARRPLCSTLRSGAHLANSRQGSSGLCLSGVVQD